MSHKPAVSSELSRELSLFHITMMGLGMMIGAGVFLGVGNAIHESGPGGVILTFALNGVLALFTAMSYAELASAVPRAGGAYNFARIGFGRGTSFLAGWMEWFASTVAGSMYALTFAIYTLRYLSHLGMLDWAGGESVVATKFTAFAIALFFLYINYRGASETGKVGAFFTLGQTAFLIVIGIIGVVVAIKDPSRLQNFTPFLPHGWSRLLVTMGFTYVAFEGFEVISQAGDETIDPRRNLPKAMLYSVYIVTLTYIAVAFATIVAVKHGTHGTDDAIWVWIGSHRERGFGEAVARLMPAANLLLTLAVIFASTSALNATIYSATRASYALGRDRMLPGIFSRISSYRKTPWVALTFTGILLIFVAVFLPTMDVASSASIMFLFLFFLVNICVIKVRSNMGDELTYGFVQPFFPIFPIIAIICQAVLAIWLIHMSLLAWIIAPLWIFSGFAIYRFYSRSRAVATEEEILVLEEEKEEPSTEDQYRVMVSVANPDNALDLVRNTYKLCEAKQGSVELLHVVRVPDQVPLHDADKYMLEGKVGVVEIMLYLASSFPVSTTIRYCRNIARAIVNAVREKRINLLILGWHGRRYRRTFRMGSTIDPIIERTPCNVVIMKDCGNKDFKRILVPLAGGPNSRFALEVAGILAEDDGEIVAFTAERDQTSEFDIETFVAEFRERHQEIQKTILTKTVRNADIIGSILSESENYDLVILGASLEPLIKQVTRDSIPEIIAQQCPKPLIMVKASGGIRSWIKRWL